VRFLEAGRGLKNSVRKFEIETPLFMTNTKSSTYGVCYMAPIRFPLVLYLIIYIHVFLVIFPFVYVYMNSSNSSGLFLKSK
jgi:hypothetical protein